MTMAPVVSVVTPVYNGVQHLAECIESVLRQKYSNWEYVIVDNMSNDGSATLAEQYAAQDARIRVVRAPEFTDVYGNHNRAIREMDPGARYCKFVHADDWLYPGCIEEMVRVAEAHPAVGMVSAFRLVGASVLNDGMVPYLQSVVPGRAVVRRELLGPLWVTGSPTSVLFRTDVLRDRGDAFDSTVWHADTDTAYRVLMQSDFGFVHQVLSYTRIHPGALTAFSDRVGSFRTRHGRMLLRYGLQALSPVEYRRRMQRWLGGYARFLFRESVKLARLGDTEFHAFHVRDMDYMIAEAGQDYRARLVLLILRGLLKSLPEGLPRRSTDPQPAVNAVGITMPNNAYTASAMAPATKRTGS
jgi:glycosyltransferase involved in cell wall biosynthesis